jgi:hypothetical protein
LHYNHGSMIKAASRPYYTLDEALGVLRANDVTGILVSSTPNDGTRELAEAKPQGLVVVPFLRPYRSFADYDTWFDDTSTLELIESELAHGYYRGIGEFHIHGDQARSAVARKVVEIAVKHDLVLHAHCDDAALQILFAQDPNVRIIWAHSGFDTTPARFDELFAKYPKLWGELSYQSGPTGADGKITDEWRALFAKHSERFLIGSDTWENGRWAGYGAIANEYRAWLAQLPADQAARIASGNAVALFAN